LNGSRAKGERRGDGKTLWTYFERLDQGTGAVTALGIKMSKQGKRDY